jgi:serine/threonine-protein phosphatase 2A regulatory subunit B'
MLIFEKRHINPCFALDVPQSKRQELFVIKLIQCQVLFDFNDPSSDLRNKEIKRQELQEMLEYVATSRGAISDLIYPDVIRMVKFCS